ncbi:MAG: AmmeMemoRadiSam system protein A [Gammaproteobacteria bacterium]|nr:AmmeMemoRadiSam system protein A [Gammaproteobacteria bacterium]
MEATLSTRLEPRSRDLLLRTAATAIESGLASAGHPLPDLGDVPEALRREQASFVTITIEGRLRGCCGSLEARHPLVTDVWRNAQASAFRDPRFDPLQRREWLRADLEVSVLSPLERVVVSSELELLHSLRPGVDGLVIAWRGMRATFLPKVWEQLPEPREFLQHLKQKAGWQADFWAPDIEVWRYGTDIMSMERPASRSTRPPG